MNQKSSVVQTLNSLQRVLTSDISPMLFLLGLRNLIPCRFLSRSDCSIYLGTMRIGLARRTASALGSNRPFAAVAESGGDLRAPKGPAARAVHSIKFNVFTDAE